MSSQDAAVRLAPPVTTGVVSLVLQMVKSLRNRGLAVSTGETLDAIRALAEIDVTQRSHVRHALHVTLVKDDSHEVLFTRVFEATFPRWRPQRPQNPSTPGGSDQGAVDGVLEALQSGDSQAIDEALDEALERFSGDPNDGRSAGHHVQRTLRRLNVPDIYKRYLESSERATDLDKSVSSAEASLAVEQMKRRLADLASGRIREMTGRDASQQMEDPEDRPLLRAGPDELAAMRQAMRPLARKLATRLSNRRRRGTSGLDMRRTIRASMQTGGVPVKPVLRRKRPTKPDLIVLCDVSGSTAEFAPFTLTMLHAVHQEFRRVRSFVFIDGIVEITELLQNSPGVLDPHHLLARKGLVAHDGRSDYHRALSTFIDTWGDSVTAKTSVIIAGDARSHDRASALPQIAELDHRARRLYWLNPEPMKEWGKQDSRALEYANHCTAVFEVSTIRDLMNAVLEIV